MFKPELLAPAGSLKVLKAAVNLGADAVYFGLPDFNARAAAVNFTKEDCYAAMDYLKARGKKAYITLNTLVKNNELKELIKAIKFITSIDADAVIVQDLGVAQLIKSISPDLEIHASTQMTVHNTAGVNLLYNNGFKRIVLSRELSLKDIEEIKNNTPAELEVFIHGALCVCYSGQCQMSSFIGERSGNRGKCAQPCRMKYSFNDEKENNYYLSLSDLTSVEHIKKLSELKIDSLKIEGRLKSEYYAATVVDCYRKVLDDEILTAEELDLLYTIFNRGGYTDGYLTENKGRNMFCYQRNENPFTDGEEKAVKKYKQLISQDNKELLVKTPVNFDINIKKNENPVLTVSRNGFTKEIISNFIVSEAKNVPITEEKIKENLSKLGDSGYSIDKLTVKLDDNCYMPLSEINALRREAVLQLNDIEEENAGKRLLPYSKSFKAREYKNTKLIAKIRNAGQYEAVIKHSETEFILIPFEIISTLPSPDLNKTVIVLPRIIFDKEKTEISNVLKMLKNQGFKYASASNISHFEYLKGFEIFADPFINITNSLALEYLENYNVKCFGISDELNLKDIRYLDDKYKIYVTGYGHTPLMITENCLKKSIGGKCNKEVCYLTDRMNEKFKIICSYGCRNEILNPHPVTVADKQEDLRKCGVDYILLDFTVESANETENIINMFITENNTLPKITRGHFYRGAK